MTTGATPSWARAAAAEIRLWLGPPSNVDAMAEVITRHAGKDKVAADALRMRGALNALLAYARPGSPEEKIIRLALGIDETDPTDSGSGDLHPDASATHRATGAEVPALT